MCDFSVFTLVFSRPMFSTLPTIPTARMTRSTVMVSVLPLASMVVVTLSAPFWNSPTLAPV